ncbi:S-adenosyl-L-methionine-dependent methyltransferase [Lophium mytilinum]|uniref:S-adenosyl-L-methionine-dependent methyltransferase n=1 Tax=Lophium mytilinum TaxID=390894 RepID=A0A6A6R9G3_9PEZI|nr:S-adenosyl-L-methionine-dependent methyltransferase [Lophium mytilinum]
MPNEPSYVHGHHSSVLRSHSWRTVENSCPHLLPHMRPDAKILDVGCGPGTITCDLAQRVPQGSVIGVDMSVDVLKGAEKLATEQNLKNLSFTTGNIYSLDYPDASFDIVHVHQVLQHIDDPVRGMRELRRVTKPGGLVACRDVDYAATLWYPETLGLKKWCELYQTVAKSTGGDPNIGRRLHAVAREAGFQRDQIDSTVGTWCFSTQEELDFWCNMWADRMLNSEFKVKAKQGGFATDDKLERFAQIWRSFAQEKDGWCTLIHGQLICRV